MNHAQQRSIVLASASPRRRELLKGLGLNVEVYPSAIDELWAGGFAPVDMVEQLSLNKALSVVKHVHQGLVIGSDTIVVLDKEILGKPKTKEEAFSMLSELQGRVHTVYTGLAIIDVETDQQKVGHQSTSVRMRPLHAEEINRYIATEEPMDKAGAYGIQGIGATLIEGIKGDYFTVVGLPLHLTARFLLTFGVDVLKNSGGC